MKKNIKIVALILMVTVLVSCGKPLQKDQYDEIKSDELSSIHSTPGGTIHLPISDYHTLHPLYTQNSSVYYVQRLLYDTLFRYTNRGDLESSIVEHYEVSTDGTIVSLTLRDDVYFHNGDKLTATDVVDTFNTICSMEDSIYHSIFKNGVGSGSDFDIDNFMNMSIFDERNIDITMDKPYRDFLHMLTFPILSTNDNSLYIVEDKDEELYNLDTYVPNGTGPYKLSEVSNGEYIRLDINENYYGRLPYIETVFCDIYSDFSLAGLAFETGELDIYNLSNTDWNKYIDDPQITIEEYSSNQLDLIYFNSRSPIFQGNHGRKIKQAIARGINKKRIIDRVFLGHGEEVILPLDLNSIKNLGLKSDIYYNADIAVEVLESLGYNKSGSSGLLVDENGDTIDINIKTNMIDPQKRIVENFIVEDLTAIGINAYNDEEVDDLKNMPKDMKDEYQNNLMNSLKAGDYDMAIVTVNLNKVPDLGAFLHSGSIGSGLNLSYYSNGEVDSALERIKTTRDDEALKENYLTILDRMAEDVPILPLYIRDNALLKGSRIQGDINPDKLDIYNNFRDVFILKQSQ